MIRSRAIHHRVGLLISVILIAPLLVTMSLPVVAQDFPADTLAVVKADEAPSNAEIAVRLSESTDLPDTSTVVIGRDDEFADSLASGVLQSTAPLLLVPRSGPVPQRVRDELARLGPDRVILLGGEAALEPQVADELAGLGYAVERRAGASRFETATAIARSDAGTADTAILARAFPTAGATDPTQAFADALAAGGMAAEMGWPVLLTQTEVLTGSTRTYLQESGIREVKLMGGTAAISAAVEAELQAMGLAVERIAGASRADTAIEVAKARGADSAADAAHVLLVQGQEADAWAGGFAAAARSAALDAPIVLAAESQLPPETRTWLEGGIPGTGSFSQAQPVLTCVVIPELCEQARVAMGLPPAVGEVPDLVSLGVDGAAAGGRNAVVAAGGAVVAFVSGGVVVDGVADGEDHVYLARLGADGVTDVELVDVRPDGSPAARGVGVFSGVTDLSADGRFVGFQSSDGSLDASGITTNLRGAYVRDLQTGTTRLVSLDQQAQPITPLSIVVDDDASVAVYRGRISEGFAILHHDLATGDVQPVLLPDGTPFDDGTGVGTPEVSGDGSTVAFYTDLPLLPSDTNDGADVYVYNIPSRTLELASVGQDGSVGTTSDINDD
ncbi:MAG TPA: cell wall-binding repeat-containing protein, partial [Euzebya sp.]|nr:cell wall-binding repeat-containing protein [Euzebya sp.]